MYLRVNNEFPVEMQLVCLLFVGVHFTTESSWITNKAKRGRYKDKFAKTPVYVMAALRHLGKG